MSEAPCCRSCGAALRHSFCDLGVSPLANSYVPPEQLQEMEAFHPLHALTCEACFLVQIAAVTTPEAIFSDYAYFSSFSDSWLAHCRAHARAVVERFGLCATDQVVEVASNDGYLLQYFRELGIQGLGIEPAANVAAVARERGIETIARFFGKQLASELAASGRSADVLLANNVLAHVPDLNDFVAGLSIVLKPDGVLIIEFPHLLNLIEQVQFDTIYHEHCCYFSFLSVRRALGRHGLRVFDVEEIPTHGGSLRIFVQHERGGLQPLESRLEALEAKESRAGLDRLETYGGFEQRVRAVKRDLLAFLIDSKRKGLRVAGYGAPAKGNTLLNYCGIRTDFVDFTVDRSPAKQGRYLPGTRIPVHAPERILAERPDFILVLPWNLRDEIMDQMAQVRDWGGRFVFAIPTLEIV